MVLLLSLTGVALLWTLIMYVQYRFDLRLQKQKAYLDACIQIAAARLSNMTHYSASDASLSQAVEDAKELMYKIDGVKI